MLKLPKNEGLNIVPFIDIMLVLLAIILSISTFIAHGQIKINLPPSENSFSVNENKEKFSVLIDEQNVFYIDDKPSDIQGLSEAINTLNPQTLVELQSDKNAKFESFVQVIDLLKAKKHENFQILTQKNR